MNQTEISEVYPTSARHGLRWYELDFNWLGIRALQLVGVAYAVKRVRFSRTASTWQLVRDRVTREVC